jgi:hypothetical protein
MIKLEKSRVKQTIEDFRKKIVMTIDDLINSMQCSTITVRRYLKQWHAITSYNKNGCYYVLPDIPKFSDYGLWQYKTIRFSKYGSLKRTIIHLVEDSLSGRDASEIAQLVAMDPHPILSRLIGKSALQRKKVSGVFVYFSVNEQRLNSQFQKRLEMRTLESIALPSDTVGVAILVERIKNPKLTSKTLSRRLQNRGITVPSKMIENFLIYHGILKKTADFVSS